MSTIDRYRPQREGYQPPREAYQPPKEAYQPPRETYQLPSLPPKPPPTIADRQSKSPSRRRDVPPAVPSPPTHTSRTSPPRPQSRRSMPSPAQPVQASPQRASQPRPNQWFFTADEVVSTPSIIDGLSPAEERLRRAKGVNFIYQAGILLELPQVTLWVAGVFFHRFFMRFSMVEEKGGVHHYNIAATSLFLANKTEENCRKTKDLIIAVVRVAQKNPRLEVDEQNKEYWRWRDSILAYEELMLEILTFDLMIENPYIRMWEFFRDLHLLENRPLRDAAWAFCNDACLTVLPLLLPAREIAIAALFFASSVTHIPIDDIDGQPWWQHLRANETNTIRAVRVLTDFYKENPLRKQDAKVPGSPKFDLESTRRRGDLANLSGLSQLDLDSSAAASSRNGTVTPSDGRAGTQSPRKTSVNGSRPAMEGDSGASAGGNIENEKRGEEAAAAAVSAEAGDSDAALKAAANDISVHHNDRNNNGGLVSPSIKRSVEHDVTDEARNVKKQKVEEGMSDDEDEGEIKGS